MKCVPILLPLYFLYTASGSCGVMPSRWCRCSMRSFARVGQKAASPGVDRNSICTPCRFGFFWKRKVSPPAAIELGAVVSGVLIVLPLVSTKSQSSRHFA